MLRRGARQKNASFVPSEPSEFVLFLCFCSCDREGAASEAVVCRLYLISNIEASNSDICRRFPSNAFVPEIRRRPIKKTRPISFAVAAVVAVAAGNSLATSVLMTSMTK